MSTNNYELIKVFPSDTIDDNGMFCESSSSSSPHTLLFLAVSTPFELDMSSVRTHSRPFLLAFNC